MIAEVLSAARARIERYTPADAAKADALIVDLRCEDSRRRDGIVPGSVHVPRSVLEWRADPTSGWSNPSLAGRKLILMCDHGYSSSLAAIGLLELAVHAAELVGGFEAWAAAGLPTAPAPEPGPGLPGMGGPQ